MRRLRSHLTYANVMSTLAAFVAVAGSTAYAADHLGRDSVGTAQLKPDSVTGAKVRNGSLRGADIDVQSLPTVPGAQTAQSAATAQSAVEAKHADSAAQADHATSAALAATAVEAGRATTATDAAHAAVADTAVLANSLAAPEARHVVGEPGEPRFEGSFTEESIPTFYLDREGIAHLEGLLLSTVADAESIFVLPHAYVPRHPLVF